MGMLIWFFCLLVCGGVLFCTGIRWRRERDPVGLWPKGKTPKRTDFTDPDAYNKGMGRVMKLFSIPFFVSGACFFWHPLVGGVLAVLSVCPGLVLLVVCLGKVYRKYAKAALTKGPAEK